MGLGQARARLAREHLAVAEGPIGAGEGRPLVVDQAAQEDQGEDEQAESARGGMEGQGDSSQARAGNHR